MQMAYRKFVVDIELNITLLNFQLSFCGPSKYNNRVLEKKAHMQIELPAS